MRGASASTGRACASGDHDRTTIETTYAYGLDAGDDASDRARLRWAVTLALSAHVALLFLRAPDAAVRIVAEPPARLVHVLETFRPRPPEAPPERRLPQRRARRVPVPDPTPDAPEPERILELEPVSIDAIDELPVVVPPAPPEPAIEGVFDVGGEVSRPVKVYAPAPAYTEIARRARIQGVVEVRAIIDREGRVVSAEIVRGLPMGLSEATLEAVRTWRFEPGTLRGRPVAVALALAVTFQLQ
jgi:TonB family protein